MLQKEFLERTRNRGRESEPKIGTYKDDLRKTLAHRKKLKMPTTQDTKLTTKTMLNLPDILQDWPWERQINTHHEAVASEATVWLQSFKAFSPKAQDAFDRCNFS